MKTKAAAILEAPTKTSPGKYETIAVELDEPRRDELIIRMAAAGLCHSDDHMATGDLPLPMYPFVGGHEGAGVVEQIGPGTPGFEVGDHVVFSFIASCGHCRWCASGMQNLCDDGKNFGGGVRRHLSDGTEVAGNTGTFSEYTIVNVHSVIKIDRDLPLDRMALLSCGVPTGWGAAVNSAQASPGDTIIVMGVGGIGINAVQGAANAGADTIVAVDPVTFKREKALALGATHAFETIAEADVFAKSVTTGQGADAVIVTTGVVTSAQIADAFSAIRKAGTVVVTGLAPFDEIGVPISLLEITLYQKRIQGSLYGQMSPNWSIPRLIGMYRNGTLKLDELITTTYTIDQVAQGYADMHAGTNIRGVVVFD
jgi:NDMA-dependent alcohol dehydrogenase